MGRKVSKLVWFAKMFTFFVLHYSLISSCLSAILVYVNTIQMSHATTHLCRKNDRLLFTKRKSTSKRSNSILAAHANGHLYLWINLLCWFQYKVARKSHGSMLDLIIIYVQFLFCTKKLLQLKCLNKGENNFLLAKLMSIL